MYLDLLYAYIYIILVYFIFQMQFHFILYFTNVWLNFLYHICSLISFALIKHFSFWLSQMDLHLLILS